jgi:predicted enzyme related to lactoylglutathione lyase
MGSHWHAVVVDATDPARLGRWWAEVLGLRILGEHNAEVTVGAADGVHPVLHFARSEGTRPGAGRLQLDLRPDDSAAEVERLVNMGARPVDNGHEGAGVLLVDPEGNEFRVLDSSSG